MLAWHLFGKAEIVRVRYKSKTLRGAIRAMIEQLLILVPLSVYFVFFFAAYWK